MCPTVHVRCLRAASTLSIEDFVPSVDEDEDLPPEPLPEYKEPEPIEPSPFLQTIVMEERRRESFES